MSAYKPKGRAYYIVDFQLGGRRFCVSTEATTKRAAEQIETAERDKAKQLLVSERAVAAAFQGEAPLSLGLAGARYWEEAGKNHVNAATTWTDINRALLFFGSEKRIDQIRDGDIARFVAKRRGETLKGRKTMADGKPAPLVLLSTVNRSTVDFMRKLLTYARKKWTIALPHEPDWKEHRLKERGELVREMKGGAQETDISNALSAGHRDLWRFAAASGLRLAECFLQWKQIDWDAETITVIQKGNRAHTIPLTRAMCAILASCRGHDKEWVFCYVAQRPKRKDGLVVRERGQHYPVTYEGMKTEWRRKVKIDLDLDLRFHDMRHTRATRTLRTTGNLKTVQRLLGHADIATTAAYYAHVTMDDVRDALERDKESRQKSRRPNMAKA
jgi:integrase